MTDNAITIPVNRHPIILGTSLTHNDFRRHRPLIDLTNFLGTTALVKVARGVRVSDVLAQEADGERWMWRPGA